MKVYYVEHVMSTHDGHGVPGYSVHTSKGAAKRALNRQSKIARDLEGERTLHSPKVTVMLFELPLTSKGVIDLLNLNPFLNTDSHDNWDYIGGSMEHALSTEEVDLLHFRIPDILRQPSQTPTLEEVVESRAEELRKEGHDVVTFIMTPEEIMGVEDD